MKHNYNNIPQMLKELPQWVTINNDKRPMQTGMEIPASSTNPKTWCSFNRAVQSVEEGERTHIGFVFADNGIVGIDIDDGFDEDGFLTELALDCMTVCHSYTEYSKSGRGVHILVKGTLPFKGRNNNHGAEIYCNERYFITTGDVLIYPNLIENQQAINYIVDTYFPEMTKISKDNHTPRIYSVEYPAIQGNRIPLEPTYHTVATGGRHSAMLSLGGQLWVQGCSEDELTDALTELNAKVCDPPLENREIAGIVKSIREYER